MADIKVTDGFGMGADLKLRDDSPLAKAKLTQILTMSRQFIADFARPVDQANDKSLSFGATFGSSNLLSDDLPNLTIKAGVKCGLTILNSADGLLFADDGFSPVIPIGRNQAWLGIEVDATANAAAAASVNGVGVLVTGNGELACSTYTLFSAAVPPLPLLRDACATGFGNFSLTTSPKAIRDQVVGTVNVCEVSGSIEMKVSYNLPVTLNALASATLPFNETLSVQPDVSVQMSGSIKVIGDFLVRSFKTGPTAVRLGVYKKCGTTFTVKFTAGAGVGGNLGDDDVLAAVLSAALPGVDVVKAGITGDNAAALNNVLKGGIDRSLTAQINTSCSATRTHEAAILYDIDLTGSSLGTEDALAKALRGDWTALQSLPAAHCIRNIVIDTVEKKTSMTLNLFGFYSASSTTDYLRNCTILVDESGQVSITDKLDTSRISSAVAPYAADSDKLRQALMEDFLCTASYAVIGNKLNLKLAVVQSFFAYQRNMSADEMRQNVFLGYSLGVVPKGSMDAILSSGSSFGHACVTAVVRYDTAALFDMFYLDPDQRIARSEQQLQRIGRDVMCEFLNPADSNDAIRMGVLKNDSAWAQMLQVGPFNFGQVPYLSHLGSAQLAVVAGDYTSIVWWTGAISKVAPALSDVLKALEASTSADPASDGELMKQRSRLANILGEITRKTDAAFVHGWGAAVMFALSGRHGAAQVSMRWDSKTLEFPQIV